MVDPDEDLMASAATLYYLDGRDQQQVAAILGVSRSKVSRLLSAARERGVVRIGVVPYEPRDVALEAKLCEGLGLRHAVVVKARGRSEESVRRSVGYFAAPLVARLLRSAMNVGVSGGRTVAELVPAMERPDDIRGIDVVQLMGHLDPTAGKMDAPEVGRVLAQRFGGAFYALNAPAFAPDRATRDAFLAHEQIRRILRRCESLDLALVGIGTMTESMFAERGVLAPDDYARLRAQGAVGEICGRFFDRDGQECTTDERDRVVAIGLDRLRNVPEVVAVTNGPQRREAILAALRGGLITSLVIDDLGAEALLDEGKGGATGRS